MTGNKKIQPWILLLLLMTGGWVLANITSCGKQSASPAGLNVRYEVFNLSPDLRPVNLFIDFKQVNGSPYVFTVNQGYFYVPSIDTPYQIRSALISGIPLLSRSDLLKSNLSYSLFITGNQADASLKTIFTVDTASSPTTGRGKIRFVNASPTGVSGLDVYANSTLAFSKITYTNFSKYIELPVGNYDFQINTTGTASVIKDVPSVTIQDGKIYTLYAYGYTSRIDTAAFNAGLIVNK